MKKWTHIVAMCSLLVMGTSFRLPVLKKVDKNTYLVVITKSKYELQLFNASNGEWIASYPVVFGSKDLGDKMMQGDRKTPEGTFHIVSKRSPHKWT
jgi:murein L,D-transpeptidase YafK